VFQRPRRLSCHPPAQLICLRLIFQQHRRLSCRAHHLVFCLLPCPPRHLRSHQALSRLKAQHFGDTSIVHVLRSILPMPPVMTVSTRRRDISKILKGFGELPMATIFIMRMRLLLRITGQSRLVIPKLHIIRISVDTSKQLEHVAGG